MRHCFFQYLRTICHNLVFVPTTSIVNKMLNYISEFKTLRLFKIIFLFYCLGICLNLQFPFADFYFFQFLFMAIAIIAFFSVKYYLKKFQEIREYQEADAYLGEEYKYILSIQQSWINIIAPIFIAVFFYVQAFFLVINCAPLNISVVYLTIEYFFCVFISILGYLQFVYLVLYTYQLNKNANKIKTYEFNYPSNTKWFVELIKLFNIYRGLFFLLGTLYIIGVIYFVISPNLLIKQGIMQMQWKLIPLALFWGGVFIAIVLFFPVCCIYQYIKANSIAEKLKLKSVSILHATNINSPYYKTIAIICIFNTPTYPFKNYIGIAYSFLFSLFNFIVAAYSTMQIVCNFIF